MRDLNALKRQPNQGVDARTITGDVPPHPAPASGVNPLTPQPLDPSRSVTGQPAQRTTGTPKKKPHPLLSPPVLVTAGLLVVLAEVALCATVGLLWWAAINLLLVLVLLGSLRSAVAWWRRQLAPTAAGRPGTGKAAAAPASAGGRSPLGRLFGRSGGRTAGGPGSGRSGTERGGGLLGSRSGRAGSGRKGGLGRLLSGGRRTGSGTAGRSGAGSGLRGLLSGGGRRSGSGRSGTGLRGLLGGRKSAGGTGRSGGAAGRTAATAGRRGGGSGALGRMRSAGRGLLGRSGSRPSGATPRRSAARPAGKPRPRSAGLAGFFKGVSEGARATSRKPATAPAPRKPEPPKGEQQPVEKTAPRQQAERKPSPQPRAVPKENRTMVQHQDDVSLQRWGRNLTSVSPAIEELAKQADAHGELAGAVATAVNKLATQGDDELPAAKTVVAEAAAIAAELKQVEAEQAAAAQKLRSLMGRADALGASYQRNHEVDEARLAGERGGRHKEKRADVGQAEQDT